MPSLFSLRELIAFDNFVNAFPQCCPSSSPVPVKHTKSQRRASTSPETHTGRPGQVGSGPRSAGAAGWEAISQVAKANPWGRRWQGQLRPLVPRRHQPRGGHDVQAPRDGSPRPSMWVCSEVGERCRPALGLQPGREAQAYWTGADGGSGVPHHLLSPRAALSAEQRGWRSRTAAPRFAPCSAALLSWQQMAVGIFMTE